MSSGKMLKIPNRYKHITPASKSRRWLIPLSILSDLSPIIGGVLICIFLPFLVCWWANLLGILIVFVGIYRIIYHVVMGVGLYKAVYKKGIRNVWSLISQLALKTPTDVLALLYRHIKHGYFINLGVDGFEIYEKSDTKKE